MSSKIENNMMSCTQFEAHIKNIYIYMWEPKMCRLAWQLLGMLGNVLGRPWHASQRPRHALQRPRHAWQCPRRPRHAFS